jgi:hypothetical protein
MGNVVTPNQARLYVISAIIFLSGFFLITTLTVPALQINDEWITANQLHQLVQGHQVLSSEGKYGSDPTGGRSQYFTSRGNILGYSLLLPILASGPMLVLMMLGEYFRFTLLFFWSLIPVCIALIIHLYLPEYSTIRKIPILIPAMFTGFFLLFLNLLFFYPFPADFQTDPLESAAMICTANILFGILCVILFFIGRELFHQPRQALFVTVSLIACSSFIYWGTSGKDHILSIVLFTGSILFLCKYINMRSRLLLGLGFFFLGLTAWVRPELGLSLFFTIGLFFGIVPFFSGLKKWNLREYLSYITPVFAFFAGLIPFFLNNYLLTGNPLFSPLFKYYTTTKPVAGSPVITSGIMSGGTTSPPSTGSGFSIEQLSSLFMKQYSLDSSSILNDLKGIFFFADNGSMTIAALSPLLCIGLVTLVVLILQRKRISKPDSMMTCMCLCAILGLFIAYMRSMHGLHTSEGIAPDIRYLAPIYIPGGLIGLIGMKYWKYCPIDTVLWKRSIVFIFIGAPVLLIGTLLIQPFGGGFFYYNYSLSLCSFGLLFILTIQFLVMEFFGIWHSGMMKGNLILLLVVPIAWQIMMVFLFSIAKFDGYSFWIPMSEVIISSFIVPVT